MISDSPFETGSVLLASLSAAIISAWKPNLSMQFDPGVVLPLSPHSHSSKAMILIIIITLFQVLIRYPLAPRRSRYRVKKTSGS